MSPQWSKYGGGGGHVLSVSGGTPCRTTRLSNSRDVSGAMFSSYFRESSSSCRNTHFRSLSALRILQGGIMSSYFLAETLKYLYLLFDPHNWVHQEEVLFTTEGHVFPLHWRYGTANSSRRHRPQQGKQQQGAQAGDRRGKDGAPASPQDPPPVIDPIDEEQGGGSAEEVKGGGRLSELEVSFVSYLVLLAISHTRIYH